MIFYCKICHNKKTLYKVKFTQIDNKLVCKEAVCCNKYMTQLITKEYEGLPDIKRNEEIHTKKSGDELWNKAKKDLLSGEGIDKHAKNRTTK